MKLLTILFIFSFNFIVFSQDIIINEVSSINSSVWVDENNDTPDWIELKNISSSDVNLKNYRISDKDNYDKAWVLPDTVLRPNDIIVISASDGAHNSSDKFVVETAGAGIVPGYDKDGFTYLYMKYNGDFVAEFDIASMRSTSKFCSAGITFKEELNVTAKHFGVYHLNREFINYGLMNRTKVGAVTDIEHSYHNTTRPLGLIRLERKGDTIIASDQKNGYHFTEFARIEASFSKQGYLGISFSNAKMIERGTFTFSSFKVNGKDINIDSLELLDIKYMEYPSKLYKSNEIHTDFKLSRNGENLTLWNAEGEIEHFLEFPSQNVDISLARNTNNEMQLSYPATPGFPNSNFYEGICDLPELEIKPGFYDSPQNIVFNLKPGETIYYTVNGDEPTLNDSVYSNPIQINQTTVVRAKAFATGKLPSKTLTRTFFIGDKYSLPVVSIASDSLNFWNETNGLFNENYLYWSNEKLGHFEIWDKLGQLEMYSDGTIRLHGQKSRMYEQKSLRFHANAISDSTEYTHPFFGKESYKTYEKILFRNGGTGWVSTFLSDAFNHQILKNIPNMTTSNYRVAISLLNGDFYGLVNIREKVDEHLLAVKFNISVDSINFIEDNFIVSSGSASYFDNDLNHLMSLDMSKDQSYQFVEEHFDLDNYYSYMASQIFICNVDWPWKNVKFWMSEELDGKWRFVPYDMDLAFGCSPSNWEYNIFSRLENDRVYPKMMTKLWENQKIKEATINRICDLMNSVFLPENTKPILEKMISEIKPYINLQQHLYKESCNDWNLAMDKMIDFADLRAFRLREHMIAYFECGDSALVNVDINNSSAGYVRLNSLTLNTFPWSGQYFTDVPIDVEAVANPGHKFIKWSNPEYGTNPKISVNPKDAMSLVAIFDDSDEGLPIVINEIMYKASDSHDTGDWIEIYNPNHEPADLSLWTITDSKPDNVFTFPEGTNLAPESYLVIARKGDDFQQYHSDIEYLDDLGFGLSDDDAIKIYDSEGLLIDSVDYKSLAPWPTTAAGTGSSIELIKAKLDNSLGQNWSASLVNNGTPGEKNSVDTGLFVSLSTEVAVYPNPVSRYLFIKTDKAELEYKLIDINGNTVLSGDLYYSAALNCSNFAAGSYMLELIDSGKREVIPIVIMK